MCSVPRRPGSPIVRPRRSSTDQWIQCSRSTAANAPACRANRLAIGSNTAYSDDETPQRRAPRKDRPDAEAPSPGVRHALGRADDHRRRLEAAPIPRCWPGCSRSCTSSARSRRPCSSWPAKASCTVRRTPASARRAARSARSSACARRDAVNGSHRGHHQFLAKALTHVGGIRSDLAALVTPEIQEVLQRTLAEILGLAQGYCRGPRRLDAPAVVRGRRARHERDRRRRCAAWRPATRGRRSTPAPPTSRSTTSATARARSARCSRP